MDVITSIRLSQEEKQIATKLAEYFYIKGYIKKPTISDLIRFGIIFMYRFHSDIENIISQKVSKQ